LQGGASQNYQPALCKGSSGLGRRDQQQQQQLLVVYMKNFKEVFQQSNWQSVEALLQCPERRIMRRSWHFVISIVAHVVIICHTFCVC
jgi:hypothetical protein